MHDDLQDTEAGMGVSAHMKSVQGVFVQAIAIMPLDEGHKWQQHGDHSNAAKHSLIPYNLQRLYVQVRHEVVLKGDLGSLNTLHAQ